ncbi:hypothetical protein GQX74_002637 [Glossina fuscipes]|nr:hypothetical protein GQX74_002637 [Glossina fuscipes]
MENDNDHQHYSNVPPALPARRPLSAYNNNSSIKSIESVDKKHVEPSTAQEKLETALTQFRQPSTYKPGLSVTTKCAKQLQLQQQHQPQHQKQQQQQQQQQEQQLQQYPEQHFNQKLNGQQASQTQTTFYYSAKSQAAAGSPVADNNNNNNNNHTTHSHQQQHHEHNFRKNNNVWPTNKNVEQFRRLKVTIENFTSDNICFTLQYSYSAAETDHLKISDITNRENATRSGESSDQKEE